jgi:hypothetical protein
MAVHTRVLIESKDILGIEFECPHCGTKVSYPLDKPSQALAERCPSCSQDWFAPKNPAAHPSMSSPFQEVFAGIVSFQNLLTRPDIHAHIRLQINGLSE